MPVTEAYKQARSQVKSCQPLPVGLYTVKGAVVPRAAQSP